ncbi:hypothetical protein ES708_07322 [subsurface metagenome]
MYSLFLQAAGQGAGNNRCKLARRSYGRQLPPFRNCAYNPSGHHLFTIIFYDLLQFLFRKSIHYVECRHATLSIHPHIKRRVPRKTKSPVRGIELVGRNPQVQQDSANPLKTQFRYYVTDIRKISLYKQRSIPEGLKPARRLGKRVFITIDTDKDPVRGSPYQDLICVSSTPHRPVEIYSTRSAT